MSLLNKILQKENDWSVPLSIIVGSIIISISICYSASKIAGGTTSIAKNESPTEIGTKSDVAERKDAPTIGTGKVRIVEFADFQCPYCQNFYKDTYPQIKSNYIDTGKVTFEYRHYPLGFHAQAQISAEASECATRQGKFEEYYNLLFKNGKGDGTGLSKTNLKGYASDIGLDMVRFSACLDGGEASATVKADFEEGGKLGVSGTPTFFIDGTKIVGSQPYSVFKNAIDEALK